MRKGIQLCYPFEEKRLAKWKPPYIVQPKYDGERCRGIPLADKKYMLLSSQENPFFSVPHIVNYLSSLNLNIELDGELYCHGQSFESIHSIVSRTKNIHSDHENIKYHIFDYVSDEIQAVRINKLSKLNLESSCTTVAPFSICYTLKDIMNTYDLLLNKGYEGIIVRHLEAPYVRKRSIYMMKLKPKKSDTYKIIGWEEEFTINKEPKDRLGALILTDEEGNIFNAGSGFTAEARNSLWLQRKTLIGKYARITYQHLTAKRKVPRFPIFVKILNEKGKGKGNKL